jgi:hypothetical protein
LYIASGEGNVYRITDTTAGLNEFANSPFKVYPNPANDEVFINSKDGMVIGSATIANISGQVVLEQDIDGKDARIDTSKLQTGVYVLSVKTTESNFSRKLIIN